MCFVSYLFLTPSKGPSPLSASHENRMKARTLPGSVCPVRSNTKPCVNNGSQCDARLALMEGRKESRKKQAPPPPPSMRARATLSLTRCSCRLPPPSRLASSSSPELRLCVILRQQYFFFSSSNETVTDHVRLQSCPAPFARRRCEQSRVGHARRATTDWLTRRLPVPPHADRPRPFS